MLDICSVLCHQYLQLCMWTQCVPLCQMTMYIGGHLTVIKISPACEEVLYTPWQCFTSGPLHRYVYVQYEAEHATLIPDCFYRYEWSTTVFFMTMLWLIYSFFFKSMWSSKLYAIHYNGSFTNQGPTGVIPEIQWFENRKRDNESPSYKTIQIINHPIKSQFFNWSI